MRRILASQISACVLCPVTSLAANLFFVGGRLGGTSLLRTGSQSGMASLGATPSSPHPRHAQWLERLQRPRGRGGTPPVVPSATLFASVLSNCLPYRLGCGVPVTALSVLSPPCLLCLHLSLTSLAGSCACWSAARSHACSHCCVITPRMFLCPHCIRLSRPSPTPRAQCPVISDTWRWLTLEGELHAVSDLQVMLTTNGVLLSITADVKTATGVHIITHCPVAMAQSLPLLASAQTADATSRELLLQWKLFFRRIHSNSFRMRLRQLLGPTEADETPGFRGTQYSKLVLDPISQRLPPQLRSPCHKKDGVGQWAIVLDMRTRPLNTPHVPLDVLHQIYPYVVWWAADLLATPQQKFPVGSPANVKVRKVRGEHAPRVLEVSTLLLRDEEVVGQVMDLGSPPWAPTSILALHLASGLRDPFCPRVARKNCCALPAYQSCLWRCGPRPVAWKPPRNFPGL